MATIDAKCSELRLDLLNFSEVFLWIAVVLLVLSALAEIAIKLAPLFKPQAYPPAPRSVLPADGVKLLDAFKGLITALTTAPAWLAAFAAGITLLWAAGHLLPGACPA